MNTGNMSDDHKAEAGCENTGASGLYIYTIQGRQRQVKNTGCGQNMANSVTRVE